jgi:leishmanolysin
LASGTGRPLIARTVVNPSQVPIPNGDVLVHEKNMLVILHEMIHGLGFSSSSFPYFIDSNANRLNEHITTSNIGGQTYGVLNVPVLTNKLRDYFGCNSVPGAILENSGGSATASSHFERQFFLYELMTSGSILGLRTSELTLTVLEASGWYAPDDSYGEPFTFGQGQGCSFLNYQCTGSSMWDNEFCTGTNAQRGCSPTGRGGGYCNSDPLLGNCRYMYAFENQDCEYDDGYNDARLPNVEVYGRGAGSKCFTGDLNTRASSNGQTSFCFKYTCNNNGLATTLDVQLGSTSVTCTQAGQMTVDGYYGSIDCPDPMTFCSTVGVQYCPRNCMGRGTCVNNTCQCDAGYSGTDCALGPLGA